jgi:hypothetical protein
MDERIDERHQTGTGEPRSREVSNDGATRHDESDRPAVAGGRLRSRETEQGAGLANRSGSGGSGGSGDPADEGSGGRTMDELLGPDRDAEKR